MRSIDPAQTPIPDLHQFIIGAVAPRPIAFASTISADGTPNLAPYSFFNAFGSNPPTLIFSSNRRVRGNTTKDTLSNVEAHQEVVINVVNYQIVYQMSLASVEYPEDVSEFEKAGLTPIPSDLVKPFRVKESPVQFECKVNEIKALGDQGGAPNLIICEILRIHINEDVLDENDRIDPQKIDLMGRMGRAFYCRAHGSNVFPILQPVKKIGVGVDNLPDAIRTSSILTGNNLAQLASVEAIPAQDFGMRSDPRVLTALSSDPAKRSFHLHTYAKALLEIGEVDKAWQVLLM